MKKISGKKEWNKKGSLFTDEKEKRAKKRD
jgi:hypothetical protein